MQKYLLVGKNVQLFFDYTHFFNKKYKKKLGRIPNIEGEGVQDEPSSILIYH